MVTKRIRGGGKPRLAAGFKLRGSGRRGGQTMIEYVVVAAMLVLAASALGVLLYAFREFGGRVLDLVASEYP